MNTFIYPYKAGSKGAKDLAKAMNAKRIKLVNSEFVGSPDKAIINWGSSSMDIAGYSVVYNHAHAVANCANKLSSFRILKKEGVRVPNFTDNPDIAAEILNQGHSVVVRHILNGHSGAGIEIVTDKIPPAPLYVQYVPKKEEYRVHVVQGKVIHIQRKARSKEVADENVNWQVRNHANGFIFAHKEGLEIPEDVITQSIAAQKALGIDFGAVDVIWNNNLACAFVLEVNTAPGLVGTTLDKYVEAFKEMVEEE